MIKLFTLESLLEATLLMLPGCLSAQAADDGLITQQITIKLNEAGTLPDKIGNSHKYRITNLKIVGEVNGTDWRLIRDMAGRVEDYVTDGKLAVLDLSEARIVEGGEPYMGDGHDIPYCRTQNDELGIYAFGGCSGLTNVSLPADITSIGDASFKGCSGLTSLSIPVKVTSIGKYAFESCSGLTSMSIHAGITSIGDHAFDGCSGLTSLSFYSGITSVGNAAFNGCEGLTDVRCNITGGLEKYLKEGTGGIYVKCNIKYYLNDEQITKLVIPSRISSIGENVFGNCKDLTSISVSWTSPVKTADSAFWGVDKSKCILYVPKGTYQDYWLTDVWGDFDNIVEYDPAGINAVTSSADVKEVSRHSTNGQRLSAPMKGLSIVKYSDGSVKKVVSMQDM